MSKNTRQWLIRLGWLVLLGGLLWLALRNAPLADIWASLQQLTLEQLLLILILDVIALTFVTMRWWFIIRAESSKVPLLQLVGYRMSVFALSYFTFGQVGGEPLQVLYLQKNYGLTYARATSAVIMDKLIELLTNFLFVGIGLYAIFRVGIFSGSEIQASVSVIPLAALLLWPPIHITLLYSGRFPIGSILGVVQKRFGRKKWMRLIIVSERLAGIFCHRYPKMLLASLGASLLSWVLMAVEYSLMARFLNISLDFWQTLAALTALQLVFLLPVPAGLGTMELSQVLVMRALGFPDAVGISLSLLMRARDLFNGAVGIIVASRGFHRQNPPDS